MKLGITADHRGYELKNKIIEQLKNTYEIIDCGCKSTESVDYPEFAFKLGKLINENQIDFGIAICGSGIGISIACNKVKKIRAARVVNIEDVIETRKDNDANVICLSEKITVETACHLIETFVMTPFSNEERHQRRVNKIKAYEDKNHEC